MTRKDWRNLFTGMAFLAPNILGVLLFTVFPVLFSVIIALTNWDLRRHNTIKNQPLEFVGIDNFVRLLTEADFMRFLGNTLFLMMGIPVAVAAALFSAILLSRNPTGDRRVRPWLLAAAALIASCAILTLVGMGSTSIVLLVAGLTCGILVVGVSAGNVVYRTLFYAPHFTAGVATFLLWKKLFNPQTGPINGALAPLLDMLAYLVNSIPASTVRAGSWLCVIFLALLLAWTCRRLRSLWNDGDVGTGALVAPALLSIVPTLTALTWSQTSASSPLLAAAAIIVVVWHTIRATIGGRDFVCPLFEGAGSAILLGLVSVVGQFALLGLAAVLQHLPQMAADGLDPPQWLHDYHWAKPSLMLMALWSAIGSNNMLLYLAALTNVPGELYEASDIDGANGLQKFWHVTWPQLAPTTFFILVVSIIGGLQGGFEMAKTMTNGGPAGATTTLSFFIYTEGFETGRLSFAAATSWALFILVFTVTMFNWKFGNQYVND